MIKKTLICLNEDLSFLENYFKNVFFEGNSKIACDFIYDKVAFDRKKQAIENNTYDAIVVLCEITWEGHTSAQLWGIELVQQELCLNPHIFTPVLFVSLFSQAQILQREPHKKIIAAYALGYHFIQLPIATKDDMNRFYNMERVGTLEKEDAYHFASRKAMVQAIRHDVKNTPESIEISRQRLLKLLETAAEGYQQRAEEIKTKMGASPLTVEDIIAICNEIEPWFVDEYIRSSSSEEGSTPPKNYKVLFLEDEKNLLDNLKIEAKGKIEIIHSTQTSEALKRIKQDESNEIKVVVVDFRIWDKPEDYYNQRMLEPQGYRFIEKMVAMGHYCVFIVLSELPKMFQHRISSLSPILIVPENKQLVLSTAEQRANFIQKLHYWAADTEERLKVNAFGSEKLFEFYKWLLMRKEALEKIDDEAKNLIDNFKEIIGGDVGRIYEAKNFIGFPIFEEAYNNSKTEWNLNEKPLSDDEYIDNWCKSVINRNNNRENKGNLDEEIKQVLDIEKDNDVKNFYNLIPKRLREKIGYNFSDEQREKIVKIQKGKDKRTIDFEEDKTTFIIKLIIRRFAIYLYYWFEKNNFKDKRITKLNLFLQEGKIHKNATDYPKNPDNRITSKCLYLTHKQGKKQGDKKGKDIKSLQDIALTFEEVIFFKNKEPDLYNKIK
ncbi:hypothetical protein HMPREF9075_00473 [Capnocytophaga sp. oral taxon 332 str. F0381]|jgi:hypothetical protein|uniref:hypothetical protein n=1 Tax=Capnocytophaga sp. oral taxon 332 TaxID=712213 RepID=UPI0002A21057|nr:hypothetical protein [Capnocytophaga sp. oral taxon 332]EKY11950.1 hypothetical protein HMPREF9075_00473 [Capnocytophaga sp. oral taxon 332 str. F0381]